MGREAKVRAERRQKREAARSKPAPHPEDVLAYLAEQERNRMRGSGWNLWGKALRSRRWRRG